MNIELLSQHLKSTLRRHSKLLLAVLFGALALLLYFTLLLSQATALSDTTVDILIYIIYILLVLILGSIAFIGYSLVEEEPLSSMNSYPPQREMFDVEELLNRESTRDANEDVQTAEKSKYSAVLSSARERLSLSFSMSMRGFEIVASSQTDKMMHSLKGQHPQLIALILLMIDLDKAEAILEQFEHSLSSEAISRVEDMQIVSQEALTALERALVDELRTVQRECSNLHSLESSEIREILRHVHKRDLMFALKGATQELQEKFFVNMSSKASTEFKKALASLSRVDETKNQNAIKNLYLLAQRLRENGKIRAGI